MEKPTHDEQIAICQKPNSSYREAHAEAQRRMRAGEVQVWCVTCERWQWQSELCELAKTLIGGRLDAYHEQANVE